MRKKKRAPETTLLRSTKMKTMEQACRNRRTNICATLFARTFRFDLKSFDEYDIVEKNDDEQKKNNKNRQTNASTSAASITTISEWTTKTLHLLELERVEEIAQSLDALNTSTSKKKDNTRTHSTV